MPRRRIATARRRHRGKPAAQTATCPSDLPGRIESASNALAAIPLAAIQFAAGLIAANPNAPAPRATRPFNLGLSFAAVYARGLQMLKSTSGNRSAWPIQPLQTIKSQGSQAVRGTADRRTALAPREIVSL